MQIAMEFYYVDELTRVSLPVGMFDHIHQAALLDGRDDALERDTPLPYEFLVFLLVPVKADDHVRIVALCVHFGNNLVRFRLRGMTGGRARMVGG